MDWANQELLGIAAEKAGSIWLPDGPTTGSVDAGSQSLNGPHNLGNGKVSNLVPGTEGFIESLLCNLNNLCKVDLRALMG
jgi:hypothetical protein